jgi:hypothetical protein
MIAASVNTANDTIGRPIENAAPIRYRRATAAPSEAPFLKPSPVLMLASSPPIPTASHWKAIVKKAREIARGQRSALVGHPGICRRSKYRRPVNTRADRPVAAAMTCGVRQSLSRQFASAARIINGNMIRSGCARGTENAGESQGSPAAPEKPSGQDPTAKNTVEALKRDGHVYEDAERQLTQMRAELRASEGRSPARSRPRNTSASQSRN